MLKNILVSIATLSKRDQKWIVKKLPQPLYEIWQNHHYDTKLKEAKKFRLFSAKIIHQCKPAVSSIITDESLNSFSPCYAAVILFDLYSTEKNRLSLQSESVHFHLKNTVPFLHHSAKKLLINDWNLQQNTSEKVPYHG